MADHWLFVLAAYGFAAVVLAGYWRHLVRRERELTSEGALSQARPQGATAPSEASPRKDRARHAGGPTSSEGPGHSLRTPQDSAGKARARSGEERL